MSDEKKLALARAIHGTPHATRTSFTATTWAGVERAWEWIGKNYQPKDDPVFLNEYVDRLQKHLGKMREDPQEPPMKQDPLVSTDYSATWIDGERVPPWTAEQREAANELRAIIYESTKDPRTIVKRDDICTSIAKVAPLFVSPPPVPSVEECQAAYSEGLNRCNRTIDEAHTAGIAAVRALFVQGDGDGPHQGEGFARPTSQTLDTGARRAEAADESLVESARACEPLATPKKGREDARKPDSKTVDEGGSAPSPAPAPVSHPGKPDNCPAPAPDREAVAWGSMIIKARKELDRLCQDTRGWRMSIPADHTRDSDLIFDDALRCAENEIRTRDERIATLTKERDEAISKGLAVDTANTDRDLTYLTVQRLTDRVVALREECRRYKDSVKEMKRRVALAEANERGKAQSVTREELRKMVSAAVNNFGSWGDDLEAALRAVGIEVVG